MWRMACKSLMPMARALSSCPLGTADFLDRSNVAVVLLRKMQWEHVASACGFVKDPRDQSTSRLNDLCGQ